MSIEERLGEINLSVSGTTKGTSSLQTDNCAVLLVQGLESKDSQILNVSATWGVYLDITNLVISEVEGRLHRYQLFVVHVSSTPTESVPDSEGAVYKENGFSVTPTRCLAIGRGG